MTCRIRALLFSFIALQPALWADPFEEAEVTRTVNIVSLLGKRDHPAVPRSATSCVARRLSRPVAILARS